MESKKEKNYMNTLIEKQIRKEIKEEVYAMGEETMNYFIKLNTGKMFARKRKDIIDNLVGIFSEYAEKREKEVLGLLLNAIKGGSDAQALIEIQLRSGKYLPIKEENK
jgi:hypothetical protein